MATLTVNSAASNSSTGISISTASLLAATSSNGDKFFNTGNQVVLFQNTSSQGAAAVTVTVAAQVIDAYGAAASTHNMTLTVPTSSMGALTVIGPFRPSLYNDASGFVNMTYSAAGLFASVVTLAPQS